MPECGFSYDQELKDRILAVKSQKEHISQFAYNAVVEKVNRMEKRDERSRVELMKRDVNALTPIVREIIIEMKREGVI